MRGERVDNLMCRSRPPPQPTLAESLLAEPESGRVIAEHLECGPRAISKHVDAATEGVLVEPLAAECRQLVNSRAKVSRFNGQENPELRRELDHRVMSTERRKGSIEDHSSAEADSVSRSP